LFFPFFFFFFFSFFFAEEVPAVAEVEEVVRSDPPKRMKAEKEAKSAAGQGAVVHPFFGGSFGGGGGGGGSSKENRSSGVQWERGAAAAPVVQHVQWGNAPTVDFQSPFPLRLVTVAGETTEAPSRLEGLEQLYAERLQYETTDLPSQRGGTAAAAWTEVSFPFFFFFFFFFNFGV
jgi:hypothetical protein